MEPDKIREFDIKSAPIHNTVTLLVSFIYHLTGSSFNFNLGRVFEGCLQRVGLVESYGSSRASKLMCLFLTFPLIGHHTAIACGALFPPHVIWTIRQLPGGLPQ